jgi:hypothetical protein
MCDKQDIMAENRRILGSPHENRGRNEGIGFLAQFVLYQQQQQREFMISMLQQNQQFLESQMQ